MDNIFDSNCEAIINTINCVGVMGGGLAKAFRERYPEMNEAYQGACAHNQVKVGKMWSWFDHGRGQWLINFPTKDDWRNPSKYDYIIDGMQDLKAVIADLHLKSIAIPALGCGLGGLRWEDVRVIIHHTLQNLADDTIIEIYPPNAAKYILTQDNIFITAGE